MIQETRTYEELAKIVHDVEDVLITNWCWPGPDGDFKKALARLVEFNMDINNYFATEINRWFYRKEANE